jgi:RluA family pseudouridine synthase
MPQAASLPGRIDRGNRPASASTVTTAPTGLHSRIPNEAAGRSLLDWLVGRFRYLDADGWRAALAAGRVTCDGAVVDARHVLTGGARLTYHPPPDPQPAPVPPLLHVDDAMVAIDKPPHVVAHAASAFAGRTFVPALAARLGGSGPPAQLHFVHRLDRETSGVLVLARDPATTTALQRQFADGTATKVYVALVHGTVRDDRFVVDAPIGPAGGAVTARRAVVAPEHPDARRARTECEVLQRLPRHTLLRVLPRTGRTHQIRVHLAHTGHALLGDKLYGRSDADYLAWVHHLEAGGDPAWDHRLGAGRQMLHAAELMFVHPCTGAPLCLQAPLPADVAAALQACGGAA